MAKKTENKTPFNWRSELDKMNINSYLKAGIKTYIKFRELEVENKEKLDEYIELAKKV